ncbi:uncharacterized protein LOC130691936 [Daphnia carinata]|uniref:uncharacterized protein LOC130691936 n=1 Tax=Daphnia carinata TaxID=120202 RepID=UPI00257CE13D|nr:uncharacterized protein LOC130691936 [Daphnia carinata]
MKFLFASVLVLTVSACVYAEAQPESDNNNQEKTFNAGGPESSYAIQPRAEGRFIFKTVTLSLQTSTITATTTTVTTCTTSTAGLSVCTASGRRRRGLHLSGKKEGRGLFYNENEEDNENGNVFLPLPKVDVQPIQQEVESAREVRESIEPIPYVVQPGFEAPARQNRLLFTFTTTTITSTTTVTSIASLTAICISTTGFQVCNSAGKK